MSLNLVEVDSAMLTSEPHLSDLLHHLCNCNTNEERAHLASNLRSLVDNLSYPTVTTPTLGSLPAPPDHLAERGPVVAALNLTLQRLLVSGTQRHRLAAIAAFTALIYTETESIHARAQRAANAVRVLFQTPAPDIPTASAAADMVGALANVSNPHSDRLVEHVLTNAINLIGVARSDPRDPRQAIDRARAAMIIAEFAGIGRTPKFVFQFQQQLRRALWDVVWDERVTVRRQGVRALQEMLKTIMIRGENVVKNNAMHDVMNAIRISLTPSFAGAECPFKILVERKQVCSISVVHGSLLMVASLLSAEETASYVHDMTSELCQLVLRFQKSYNRNVRAVVAEILPLLVHLDGSVFEGSFLFDLHESTLDLIEDHQFPPPERGRSLVSLSAIAKRAPPDNLPLLMPDILSVCRTNLTALPDQDEQIPTKYIFRAISHLASVSSCCGIFEREVRNEILSLAFSREFTIELVTACRDVEKAIPSLSHEIQSRLYCLIGATLRSYMFETHVGLMRKGHLRIVGRGVNVAPLPQSPAMESSPYSLASTAVEGLRGRRNNIVRDHDTSKLSAAKSPTSPSDFFKQHPFSIELNRINSTSIAIDTPDSNHANSSAGLVRDASFPKASSPTGSVEFPILHLGEEHSSDRHNSPCVALRALINYDFVGMNAKDYTAFANDYVVGYVESSRVKLRGLAVTALIKLMESATCVWVESCTPHGIGARLRPDIESIISQSLLIAVSDPSRDVRYVALCSLDRPQFLPYISQPETVHALFISFHDEHVVIRDRAVQIAAKVTRWNPAESIPALRKYLFYLLTIMRLDGKYFEEARRDATQLIQTLVHHSKSVVEPHANSILDALVIRLQETKRTNDFVSSIPVLDTISDLGGAACRVDMHPFLETLVPLIVSSILEAQSAGLKMRKAALRALTALVQNTAFVIQPYSDHERLLPGLLEMLRVETDVGLRLEVETLIGSLGAADPEKHKYAALPTFMGKQETLKSKPTGTGSAGRSLFRLDKLLHPGSTPLALSSSDDLRSGSNLAQRENKRRNHSRSSSHDMMPEQIFGIRRSVKTSSDGRRLHQADLKAGFPPSSMNTEDLKSSISLFALGGTRLRMIAGYVPIWDKPEAENKSLVGQLEHPFTSNTELYFPSVSLDLLHSIIANPRLRVHDREACQAVVNILKAVGDKCSYFLPAVVPRILWLLGQCYRTEFSMSLKFSQLQEEVMRRLGDVITIAGSTFIPYAFDTVLLLWYYLENSSSSACIVSVCNVLTKIEKAIGEDFEPVVCTVLPPLLTAMVEDDSAAGPASIAVMNAIISFGSCVRDYTTVIMVYLTKVIMGKQQLSIRRKALTTLGLVLSVSPRVEIIAEVIQPLVRLMTGVNNEADVDLKLTDGNDSSDGGSPIVSGKVDTEDDSLCAAAAVVLHKFGGALGFDVFVPVIAKALIVSRFKRNYPRAYSLLEQLLLKRNPQIVGELLGKVPGDTNSVLAPDMHEVECELKLNVQENGQPFHGQNGDDVRGVVYSSLGSSRVGSVLETSLERVWRIERSYNAKDWVKWMAEVGAVMFQQSGSACIRACVRISESYPPFVQHLFNAAFLSCWMHDELSHRTKRIMCENLEKALISRTIPLNNLQSILNLFEYMDHDERPLPAPKDLLTRTACKCGAFAKAVRYREHNYTQNIKQPEELLTEMSGEEGLVAIYEKLGHIESAVGTITHYQSIVKQKGEIKWFEKLRRWADALGEYEMEERKFAGIPLSVQSGQVEINSVSYENRGRWENALGRLRCLNEMGEWQRMANLLTKARNACGGNPEAMRELALEGKGASVALDLGRWKEFEEWVGYLGEETFQDCFYKTLLLVRQGKYEPHKLEEAEAMLYQARCKLDSELTARVSEGYPRAYPQIVESQLLVELEEMIHFLRSPAEDEVFGLQRLSTLWKNRLQGCKKDRVTWYRLLMVRTIVMPPIEVKGNWLDFVSMCRKSGLMGMARESLRILLLSSHQKDPVYERHSASEAGPIAYPFRSNSWDASDICSMKDLDIRFACLKFLWSDNRKPEAFKILDQCRNEYVQAAGLAVSDTDGSILWRNNGVSHEGRILASDVFSKLAKWGHELREDQGVSHLEIEDPIMYARNAYQMWPEWYKSWHLWAYLNAHRFETLVEGKNRSVGPRIEPGISRAGMTYQPYQGGTFLGELERRFLINAVKGYFRAINLARSREDKYKLEDSLKVLTLWFNYGGLAGVHKEFDEGFERSNIDQWLEVVPQIIARLYTRFPQVQEGVKALLTRIGKEHPHIAVYPLTVAKSNVGSHQKKRSRAAKEILDELRKTHRDIVEQAEFVSTELVRVAVLWSESWYESLDEASKMYFINHSITDMVDTLLPLHEELERGAQTIYEDSFLKEFGIDLKQAGKFCLKLKEDHRLRVPEAMLEVTLNNAWNLYHVVFKRIQSRHLSIQTLDLAYVSNGLDKATDLSLAVPGTYIPERGDEVVRIQSFKTQVSVIQSKQRPRRIGMIGSDGKFYEFLLKGREDLRQDERVMQVYGLMNRLFVKSSRRTILQRVGMRTYSVVALSGNVGLIEWVPDCDTLHQLVKEYREVRKVMPNVEHRVMMQVAPEIERLPLLHKVDLFQYMLGKTTGLDIASVLWLKSRNSEMWLDRRTTYAKSLATTSMTGYLLGLGDRHPSNVMVERKTGRVMHIDFGDCFEVAMKRERYPETVPFRLTRMLKEALEPCGVEGYFRHTSEATMTVLRDPTARVALMSMMEAFVYDPLIRWKLIGTEELVAIRDHDTAADGVGETQAGASGQGQREESELSRSVQAHNGLAAYERAEQRAAAVAAAAAADNAQAVDGAISTSVQTAMHAVASEDNDPANLQTPNERARMEQRRLLQNELTANNAKIASVSDRKARVAISRIADKLCGSDFEAGQVLPVKEQVDRLICEAQSTENLCRLFTGWCAFW